MHNLTQFILNKKFKQNPICTHRFIPITQTDLFQNWFSCIIWFLWAAADMSNMLL